MGPDFGCNLVIAGIERPAIIRQEFTNLLIVNRPDSG